MVTWRGREPLTGTTVKEYLENVRKRLRMNRSPIYYVIWPVQK